MLSIRMLLTLLVVLFSVSSLYSQNSIGIYGSVNYGNLKGKSNIDFFDSNLGGSFGIMYSKVINNRFSLVHQIGHEKSGWISRNNGEKNVYFDLYWKGSSINLFFGANYNLLLSERFKLGLLLLPKLGYVYHQEYSVVDDFERGTIDYYTNRNVLLGVDTKVNIVHSISNLVDIQLRPGLSMTSYFDNNEYVKRIWSMDIGITRKFSQT